MYLSLEFIDRVVLSEEGRRWLCRIKGAHRRRPFELTPQLKQIIKNKVPTWYKEEKSYLDSKDLQTLAEQLQNS